MSYKTTKTRPSPGHAILERTSYTYQRSRNGAWCGATCTTSRFEIPLAYLNSPEGCGWLCPSHECVTLTFEDGDSLSVDTMNTPCRGYGFGPLGYIGQEYVSKPHPKLPNIARGYYRPRYFSDEQIATFQQST